MFDSEGNKLVKIKIYLKGRDLDIMVRDEDLYTVEDALVGVDAHRSYCIIVDEDPRKKISHHVIFTREIQGYTVQSTF